ncbi:ankyrin-3 [Triangularia setosa]|uniref:Ankyrin-3 n=1 Tax=Triangularia setosa TaxID=2587417 RepID=A0AAN7A4Q0_9PEZI|nr:ankyrin-3 [Podospora setosa]
MSSVNQYTVGWVCALPLERTAATAMLDIIHDLPSDIDALDTNFYTLGSIDGHNVVIAALPSGHYGTNNAASVANNMTRTFPAIDLRLMVGIGGGVPGKHDIRLGDVVVSRQVLQYDFGKTLEQGRFQRTAHPIRPPQKLLNAIGTLQSRHYLRGNEILRIMSEALLRYPYLESEGFSYPNRLEDRLFEASYAHVQNSVNDCRECDSTRQIHRSPRVNSHPKVHYGVVASGNRVVKDGETRDRIANDNDGNVICFEMEAAGLMESFPCLAIRGICDYSDSHKNKGWQKYAAMAAAAYTKELLALFRPAANIMNIQTATGSQLAKEDANTVAAHAKAVALQKRRDGIWASLRFETLDSRLSSIKESHSQTCHWLLSHDDYLAWLNPQLLIEHHGFLWIKGNPGSGKSTIMKFAYKDQAENGLVNRLVIPFFFNARGDALENSAAGMYRALLYHCLQAVPELRQIFEQPPPHIASQLDILYEDVIKQRPVSWKIDILRELLQLTIAKLSDQHEVIFFVDALDECRSSEMKAMVEYFERLGNIAFDNHKRLKFCFSSRHYPHIDIKHRREMVLEDQDGHEQDISTYIDNKLQIGNDQTAQNIKNGVRTKARGIFMWVVLVVTMLGDTFGEGEMWRMEEQLKALPSELSELFKEIIYRDDKGLRKLQLCVQWLLFSQRQLTLLEFYFALLAEISPDDPVKWSRAHVSISDMARFLVSASKGLAEAPNWKEWLADTRGQMREPRVQFIHESVREYFRKDGFIHLWIDPGLTNETFEIRSHLRLHNCCHRYLRSLSRHIRRFSSFDSRDWVLAGYIVSGGLQHAEEAAARGGLQRESLTEFCDDLLILSHYSDGNKLITKKLWYNVSEPRFETESLVCILARFNYPYLLEIMLQIESSERRHLSGRYKEPMFSSSRMNSGVPERLRSLEDEEAPTVENSPLHVATRYGRENIMGVLLNSGISVDTKSLNKVTALQVAISDGLQSKVHLLVERGADLELRNEMGCTPILLAAMYGMDTAVQCLLEKGANIDASDSTGRTPLGAAAASGYVSTVILLVSNGASINFRDKDGRTPLANFVRNKFDGHNLFRQNASDVHVTSYYAHAPNNTGSRLPDDKSEDTEIGENPIDDSVIYDSGDSDDSDDSAMEHSKMEDIENEGPGGELVDSELKDQMLVKFLLEHGADPMLSDKDGLKPRDLTRSTKLQKLLDEYERASRQDTSNIAGCQKDDGDLDMREDEEQIRERSRSEVDVSSTRAWDFSRILCDG